MRKLLLIACLAVSGCYAMEDAAAPEERAGEERDYVSWAHELARDDRHNLEKIRECLSVVREEYDAAKQQSEYSKRQKERCDTLCVAGQTLYEASLESFDDVLQQTQERTQELKSSEDVIACLDRATDLYQIQELGKCFVKEEEKEAVHKQSLMRLDAARRELRCAWGDSFVKGHNMIQIADPDQVNRCVQELCKEVREFIEKTDKLPVEESPERDTHFNWACETWVAVAQAWAQHILENAKEPADQGLEEEQGSEEESNPVQDCKTRLTEINIQLPFAVDRASRQITTRENRLKDLHAEKELMTSEALLAQEITRLEEEEKTWSEIAQRFLGLEKYLFELPGQYRQLMREEQEPLKEEEGESEDHINFSPRSEPVPENRIKEQRDELYKILGTALVAIRSFEMEHAGNAEKRSIVTTRFSSIINMLKSQQAIANAEGDEMREREDEAISLAARNHHLLERQYATHQLHLVRAKLRRLREAKQSPGCYEAVFDSQIEPLTSDIRARTERKKKLAEGLVLCQGLSVALDQLGVSEGGWGCIVC